MQLSFIEIHFYQASENFIFMRIRCLNLVLDPWNDPWIPSVTYPNLKPYPTGKTTGIVGELSEFLLLEYPL